MNPYEDTFNKLCFPDAIDYGDILACVTVENEEGAEPPWENCDGYEHELKAAAELGSEDAWRHAQGRIATGKAIVCTRQQVAAWGVRDYARQHGASRQVAAEREAQNLQATIKQLVRWHGYGWECVSISCDFMEATDSLGGVYDPSAEYLEQLRHEIAWNVALQLERQGEIVLGLRLPGPGDKRKEFLETLRRNLHSQDWEQT